MRDLSGPRRVAELAARQDGVVSTQQLARLGADRRQVSRWVGAGWLHRVHVGVFAVGHPALTAAGRRRAALLCCGPGAALSHRTAAVQHGLWRSHAGPIDVAVPRAGRARPGLRIHRPRVFGPEDVVVVDRLPCTTVARTLVDLAATLTIDRLERVVERAEYLDVIDVTALAAVLARIDRPRGVRKLRHCLGPHRLDAALAESELERRYLRLILDAGIERPLLQAPFELAPGSWARTDFHWPTQRLVVEVDGPHHRRPVRQEKDRRRDRRLAAIGQHVHRFTEVDLDERPAEVVAITRRLVTGRPPSRAG